MATPYPPYVHHSTQPITSNEALHLIQQYLSSVETQPWLHPDAILSERGPQLAGTLSGGLTLHNLRRVEAGLRGEQIGVAGTHDSDMSFLQHHSAIEEMYQPDQNDPFENQNAMAREGYKLATNGEDRTREEEWQDIESYRRDQEITEGDIGRRDMGVADEAEGTVNSEVVVVGSSTKKRTSEKEEQRRAKETRRRERQERRAAKAKRRAERTKKK